jgi:uncharacterized protein YbjT (DUF2867 family)
MNVVIFGGSGMVGQAVLRECLLDPGIERVVSVLRKPTGQQHPKLREVIHENFFDFSPIASELTGLDVCFYCLGVTSAGMTEAEYRRVTYDMTIAAAKTLLEMNRELTFVFISGSGTDSSERGSTMWARVKGAAENALMAMPFKASYMFRPAVIQPMHGIQSKTKSYRVLYKLLRPLLPLMKWMFPGYVTTTEQLGRAMIEVARNGSPKQILESADINRVRTGKQSRV